jgi:hypothetical protein
MVADPGAPRGTRGEIVKGGYSLRVPVSSQSRAECTEHRKNRKRSLMFRDNELNLTLETRFQYDPGGGGKWARR